LHVATHIEDVSAEEMGVGRGVQFIRWVKPKRFADR